MPTPRMVDQYDLPRSAGRTSTPEGKIMEFDDMAAAVAKWAGTQPLVRKAYLFGSRVRGTHRPDSDLDVAVEVFTLPGDSSPFTTWAGEAQRLKTSIAGVVPVTIDLDWYGDEVETPRIHEALEQSSIVVYDVESTTLAIPTT
jgi:predicted nucleotidyltransferase